MRTWLRGVLEVVAAIVLVPQVFVFCYFFRYFFLSGSVLVLLKALSVYALTISWVSAPYLAALALAVKVLIRVRVRWSATLLAGVVGGYGWVAAWNLLVYDRAFSYVGSALPILLCSLCFAGYAAARALYLDSLLPIKPEPRAKAGAGGAEAAADREATGAPQEGNAP
jgi:hypothetical protein